MKEFHFKVVHASVTSMNQFIFPSTAVDIKRDQIAQAGSSGVIAGHSGIPFGQSIGGKLWLNAGVTGLPANDGSEDGWYMLLEPDARGFRVSWHRLSYEVTSSQDACFSAGMSEYGQALTTGLWPSMDILPAPERLDRGERLAPAALRVDLD